MSRLVSYLGGSLALLGALALVGCKCEDEKPYTPFEVASTLPGVPSAPTVEPSASPSAPPPGENPALRRAMKAPRDASVWKLGDKTLTAPRGHVFSLGLPYSDPQGPNPQGPNDSAFVAWTVRKGKDQSIAPGALWLYASGEPRKLTELPGFVPTGPDCAIEADLSQTGPRTITLDVSSRCTGRLVQRIPTRAVVVLDPTRPEPLLMGFRVADPAPGETLSLAVDSRDTDSDGRDDVTLRVTGGTQGPSGPSASFIWLDRAAGRSRETNEPQGDFSRQAKRLEARAKAKKTAPNVTRDASDLRRLWAAACAESGTPRVFDYEGNPLSCGDASFLARTLAAEVDAQLAQGHTFEALGALSRDGFYGARLGEKDRRALEDRVRRAARSVNATLRGSFAASIAKNDGPHFSPLWFDAKGKLWLRTAEPRIVQSDPPGTAPTLAAAPGAGGAGAADAPPATWPLRVEDPNGRIWTAAIPSCDRSEVQLGFVARDGRPLPPLPTTLLSPRPGSCKRLDGKPLSPAIPITWRGVDLESYVAGARIGAPSAGGQDTSRPGSPLSNDGKSLVLPSPLGPMVIEGTSVTLWQGDATRGVEDCVLANGAELMACVASGRVVVLERGAEIAPEPKSQKK